MQNLAAGSAIVWCSTTRLKIVLTNSIRVLPDSLLGSSTAFLIVASNSGVNGPRPERSSLDISVVVAILWDFFREGVVREPREVDMVGRDPR